VGLAARRRSLVAPGNMIFLSCICSAPKGTTTYRVPRPIKSPTDSTAFLTRRYDEVVHRSNGLIGFIDDRRADDLRRTEPCRNCRWIDFHDRHRLQRALRVRVFADASGHHQSDSEGCNGLKRSPHFSGPLRNLLIENVRRRNAPRWCWLYHSLLKRRVECLHAGDCWVTLSIEVS
jgi:hypothetical protein